MFSQARAIGRQTRNGRGSKRRHALFGSAGLHQLGELFEAVLGQRDVLVEVHQHAEHFLEVRIQVLQRRSEEHTSELQSLMRISYAVFCLKKKKEKQNLYTRAK